MKNLRLLLLPFSWLYGCAMALRNFLFDSGILKSASYPVPVICIGNLNTGGTGKTPHTEMLLHLLKDKKTVVVSRGYGRKSEGVIEVSNSANAEYVGDEPLQMKRKFPDSHFIVAEKRTEGIEYTLKKYPDTEVILLDDAFQHRSVKPGLSVLLTQYDDLFTDDFVLPAGNLREFRSGANRADIIIVTKCPAHLTSEEKKKILIKISLKKHVFFSTLEYQPLISLEDHHKIEISSLKDYEILLITGIASAKKLQNFLSSQSKNFLSLEFGDHHSYCEKDFSVIRSKFNTFASEKKIIVVTEKDAVKLKNEKFEPHIKTLPFYCLPVAVNIIEDKEEFNLLLKKYVGKS